MLNRRIDGRKLQKKFSGEQSIFRNLRAISICLAISLAGSISQKYMYLEDELDYFVITIPERMCCARTMLILSKIKCLISKIFLRTLYRDRRKFKHSKSQYFTVTELAF